MENHLTNTMLPFKVQQLVDIIIQKKHYNLEDALLYLYSSDLYKHLSSETSSLWNYSSVSLYELLKKEKAAKKKQQNINSAILLFQVFCLEKYRLHFHLSADDVLHIFLKYNVFEFLQEVFETLHTQGEEYIIREIETYINRKNN